MTTKAITPLRQRMIEDKVLTATCILQGESCHSLRIAGQKRAITCALSSAQKLQGLKHAVMSSLFRPARRAAGSSGGSALIAVHEAGRAVIARAIGHTVLRV